MKHYKKMMLLIYGALLLICIGIVWLLGALNQQGNTENNRESTVQEDTSQAKTRMKMERSELRMEPVWMRPVMAWMNQKSMRQSITQKRQR